MTTDPRPPVQGIRPARVERALRLYTDLLGQTLATPGVHAQIKHIAALLDDMTPQEQLAYYARARQARLDHHNHERTQP